MERTKHCSWKSGKIAEGCRLCVEGKKLVLFVTGICSRNCWYCPLAETKKDRDFVFANEWKTSDVKDIIKEAELCKAFGAGITGGDPFLRVERTAKYVKALKKKFGKKFHVHLYAPLANITLPKLKKLHNAGIDEIRLHPDIVSSRFWERIGNIKQFGWDVGMEIPAIPWLENETIKMVDYFLPFIKFLNINELEQSDTNMDAMVKRGLRTRNALDYSIKGSQELALKLGKKYESKVSIHYCTTRLKDAVQLTNRIKRRAKNAKEKFDKVTSEGMLVRGAVYLPELVPGFGYRRKIEKINDKKRKNIMEKLEKTRKDLMKKYKIKKNLMKIDKQKLRLLTSEKIVMRMNEKSVKTAVVTEYPTWDATEIEIQFL